MGIDEIRALAEQTLGECIDTFRAVALSLDPDYKAIVEAQDHELATLIGQGTEAHDRCIERRLTGEPIDDPETVRSIIEECSFEYEDERNIGVNDGKLFLLEKLFHILGDEEKSDEALSWVYRD